MKSTLLRLVTFYLCIVQPAYGAPDKAAQKYTNANYGFALTIPADLSMMIAPPPAPQHGVSLVLSAGGHMWVDASYDASFVGSAMAALRTLAMDQGAVLRAPMQTAKLAGLEAARLNDTQKDTLSARLVAYRPQGHETAIIYTFGLDTDAQNARHDAAIFNMIVHSFSLLPLSSK
jgi:hypothetical protein